MSWPKRILFLSLLSAVSASTSFAQYYLKVLIADSVTNEPLIGATIVEKGTMNGNATDINGITTIELNQTGEFSFLIQFVGYANKELTIKIPQEDSLLTVLLTPVREQLDEIIVSSSRTYSRIENVPTRIEVLGQDDLDEENGIKPGNIMSLLGDIAGLQMQQVSASSGNTYARIQGLDGRYTQILKDGVPLFGGISGSFSIMQIPPMDLRQIEIIKGSSSTLYGGDAIGGIINLVTKDPTSEQDLSFTVNQTTLRETDVNGYYSQRFKNVGVTIMASQVWQKAGDVNSDGLSDVPQINTALMNPKLVFFIGKKNTLSMNYTGTFDLRKGGNMDYFKEGASDTLYHVSNKLNRSNTNLKWLHDFSPSSNLSIKFSSSNLTQKLDTKYYNFDATQMIYYSEISYVHKNPRTDWVFGLNINGDIFDNKSVGLPEIYDYDYRTIGLFVQNSWRPVNKLTIESGFRTDFHSGYGAFPLPRLCFMYKFDRQFTARLNGGFGYKIPNLITYVDPETDLASIAPGINLASELSRGVNTDLNFDKVYSKDFNMTINQSFFLTYLVSPIYDVSNNPNVVFLINANNGLETRGSQTYGRINYKAVELYLGYVFTDVNALYDPEHPRPVVTPRHNFSTTLLYEPSEKWRTGLESSYIAGQIDQNHQPVQNYFLMAAMIQYNIGKVSLVLNGENLLDFRQNKDSKIYDGTINDPVFHKLWAPIDGRVINFSIKISL